MNKLKLYEDYFESFDKETDNKEYSPEIEKALKNSSLLTSIRNLYDKIEAEKKRLDREFMNTYNMVLPAIFQADEVATEYYIHVVDNYKDEYDLKDIRKNFFLLYDKDACFAICLYSFICTNTLFELKHILEFAEHLDGNKCENIVLNVALNSLNTFHFKVNIILHDPSNVIYSDFSPYRKCSFTQKFVEEFGDKDLATYYNLILNKIFSYRKVEGQQIIKIENPEIDLVLLILLFEFFVNTLYKTGHYVNNYIDALCFKVQSGIGALGLDNSFDFKIQRFFKTKTNKLYKSFKSEVKKVLALNESYIPRFDEDDINDDSLTPELENSLKEVHKDGIITRFYDVIDNLYEKAANELSGNYNKIGYNNMNPHRNSSTSFGPDAYLKQSALDLCVKELAAVKEILQDYKNREYYVDKKWITPIFKVDRLPAIISILIVEKGHTTFSDAFNYVIDSATVNDDLKLNNLYLNYSELKNLFLHKNRDFIKKILSDDKNDKIENLGKFINENDIIRLSFVDMLKFLRLGIKAETENMFLEIEKNFVRKFKPVLIEPNVPINSLVELEKYIDKQGAKEKVKYVCDSYLIKALSSLNSTIRELEMEED